MTEKLICSFCDSEAVATVGMYTKLCDTCKNAFEYGQEIFDEIVMPLEVK